MAYYIHRKDQTIADAIATCAYVERMTAQEAHELKSVAIVINGITVDAKDLKVTFYLDDYDQKTWRGRETMRYNDGTYTRSPWHTSDRYPDHFAHLSLKTPGLLAYTENDEKGFHDKQTAVRPGKYLTTYYKDLTKAQIDQYVAACVTSLPQLEITTDPHEIEKVYTRGPRSCMSRAASAYRGHVHPSRAYGNSPDIALAFVRDQTNADHFVARCIVWPDKKLAVRTYPDRHPIMLRLLENAGYDVTKTSRDDCYGILKDARIPAIKDRNGNGFILGYLDGVDCAKHEGEYLILGRGELSTHNTISYSGDTIASGVTGDVPEDDDQDQDLDSDNSFTCERCDNTFPDDEHGGDGLCDTCFSRRRTCEECDETQDRDDCDWTRHVNGRSWICESCADQSRQECDREECSNDWIDNATFTAREQRDRSARDVEHLCEECATDYARCSDCEAYVLSANVTCEECASTSIARTPCEHTADLPLTATSDQIMETIAHEDAIAATPGTLYRLEVRQQSGVWEVCRFPSATDLDRFGQQRACISHDRDLLLAREAELQDAHPTCNYRIVLHVTSTAASEVTIGTSEEGSCVAF